MYYSKIDFSRKKEIKQKTLQELLKQIKLNISNSIITISIISIALLSSCKKDVSEIQISSPDLSIQMSFDIDDNQPQYSVKFNEINIIKKSKLGFKFKNQLPLTDNLEVVNIETSSVTKSWKQVWGEKKHISNEYNQAIISLKEIGGYNRKLNIVFRLFNDGLAFRYEIPKQTGVDSIQITNEITEFNLSKNMSTWYIPANFGSYELLYKNKMATGVKSANTPVTFESLEDNIYISIHEAALTDYAGMTLKKQKSDSLSFQANLVPWPDGVKVKKQKNLKTSWRTIQISNSAGGLMESTMILNLNEPNKLSDVSWIKPSKYIGIWWGMHLGTHTWTLGERHGATTESMIKYIDFAANNNIPSVLAEGWSTGWENWGKAKAFDFVTPYSDFDINKIVEYANQKGVKIIGHHETGGDAQYYETKMDEAFSLYQTLGINDVKTGYAGAIRPTGQHHHGQYMVNHYRKVVETAAKYNLTINAHEPIKATGIRRTYPNMMTREGARGMEWNGWSDGNPPEHHIILPFTRILAGPIDYTPGIFDLLYKNAGKRIKWNGQDKGTSRINTTLAKQLALFVVFYSPQQMASDLIDNYKGHKAFQFIRDVPVDWETTKVLNAKIGKFVTVVRKDINSDDWYLGSITNGDKRSLNIDLNFLDINKKYIAEIYADKKATDWKTNPYPYKISKQEVTYKSKLTLKLANGGGQAIRFKAIN